MHLHYQFDYIVPCCWTKYMMTNSWWWWLITCKYTVVTSQTIMRLLHTMHNLLAVMLVV